MPAFKEPSLISANDYLTSELASPAKREFVGGRVYAKRDETNLHNLIVGNVAGAAHGQLRGRAHQPFNSDTKIRVRLPTETCFYYPDLSVVRHSNAADDTYQDLPVMIVEVVSRATHRVDHVEKKDAYLQISSLDLYLLVEQEFAGLVAYRRTEQGFVRETYYGLEAVVPLPEIGCELPLAEIFQRVDLVSEGPDESDA